MVFAIWILGGIYALLCTSSVTELCTMLPRAGGWYVYSRRAFGEHVGFVVGCCDWMVQSVANAFVAVALGEFVAALFPGFAGHVTILAVTSLALLAVLNWIGLKVGSRAQEVTSLCKAVALLALVITAFTIAAKGRVASSGLVSFSGQKQGLLLGWMLALHGVVITYDGWYAPIYFVEEDQDPVRNLPRSMVGTVLSCIGIYVLVNAVLFRVLTMEHLAGSPMPAVDVSVLLFGSYGKLIILLISIIAVISVLNAGLLLTPRILYGMARDGLLPRSITSVNQGGTPTLSLFSCTLASVALVLGGTFDTLIAIGAILFVVVYLSGFPALVMLRKREPDLPRPYKAWCYPWSTLAVLFASAAFLAGAVIGDLRHSLFTGMLIVLSYVASLLIVKKNVRALA